MGTESEQPVITPSAAHELRKQELARELSLADGLFGRISTLRLFTFLGAAGLAAGAAFGKLGEPGWIGATVLLGAFTWLVAWHAKVSRRRDRLEAGIRHHTLAAERLTGKWIDHPSRGERFVSDTHPYTVDLDIFGRGSVFQLVDWTHTRRGEEKLASWLSGPSGLAEVRARQAAVRDLASRPRLREELAVEGMLIAADKPDPDPLLAWSEAPPVLGAGLALRALAFAGPASIVALAVAARMGMVPGYSAVAVALVLMAVGLKLGAKIEPVAAAVSSKEGALHRYRAMLEWIEKEPFEAARLAELRGGLGDATRRASQALAGLSSIVGFLDARQNEVFRLFIGPILLWDVHCMMALERWQARWGKDVRGWLVTMGEVEALSSLGTYAADHPDHAWPTFDESPTFEATALGHPLIAPEKCVKNDVRLEGPGTALLVTGSNMSGKSTLLRAIGVNTVLAMAGAPACARSFEVSPFELRTSMRVRDSLEEGVSHFFAELQKLKRVTDGLAGHRTLLFLLDEILHGTNSRERGIGARAVLRRLLEKGAMGAVSTHDIGLVELGPELDPHLRRVHFQEQVADGTMTFDYRLRPGVVTSTNALRLMKLVGIDVDLPGE